MASNRISRSRLIRFPVLLIVTVAAAACSAQNASSTSGQSIPSCVTAVTTIPGEIFCDGYDPDLELATGTQPPAADCPREPLRSSGRPADGWLGIEDAGSGQQLDLLFDPQPAAGHPDRIRLTEAATEAVPSQFDLVAADALGDLRCPDAPIVISASFTNEAGEEIYVLWTRLLAQIDWFNEPVRGNVERRALDDGTEVVANDFDGLGQKHRVWAARPDGSVIKVIVAGKNAPSQAGWPTTTTRFDDNIPEPLPAPLTLEESIDLAIKLLD